MGPGTGVGRSRYLEYTGELVRVCLWKVVRGCRTWCGCRVWPPWGCGEEDGGDGTLRSIPGLGRAGNWMNASVTGEVEVGHMHIRRREV